MQEPGTRSCPNCETEAQQGAKFCAECGNALEITCPVCSFVSPIDANFCSNCGHAFSRADPAPGADAPRYLPPETLAEITAAQSVNPRGERRTVTMLFADIQGSTAAASGLDPEDWTDIINGAFEHLIEPVFRYEGTLARLLGDAVLAFFGAPIAHEDDPIRAVRAGLEIVTAMNPYKADIASRWGIPIDVRVGINTGLVVMGEVGSDRRVEYTALGDAVNVAARMEQTADPGTVRVTAETWSLLAGQFEGEPIGPVEVKGKSEPVDAVRVLGLSTMPADRSEERPLVGRSAELETLEELRTRLVGGTGWVASIMGEAGLGKSRLLEAFRDSVGDAMTAATDAPASLALMCAYNESYDASIPYSSIGQLLRRWWNLQPTEGYDDLQSVVAESLAETSDATAYLAYAASVARPESVEEFLSQLQPPLLHGRVREAVVSYVEAESRRRPVLIVLEDIHWSDPISLTFIESMMDLAERAPVGVLFTMRPYRDEPPWRIHEVASRSHGHRYTSLDLASLETSAAESLLDSLMVGLTISPDLKSRILDRSDGNPLFIEQMIRAIRETDGDVNRVPVPTGLRSLLTARLDRLEGPARQVAQIASVIGSEFDRPTLAALVGDEGATFQARLAELLRREIVVERPGRPGVLGFYHALMQEAAYSTMLLRTRRELHSRLAEYLLSTSPEALQEIALHFQEAGDMERAFPHLIAAGEQASRAMALSDAIRLFTTALENLPAGADPDLVIRGHDGLGTAYTLVPDLSRSEATYQRLVDYADNSGRPPAKVTALNRMAVNTALFSGDLDIARDYLEQARVLAQEVGDEFGLAEYHMNACMIAGLGGRVDVSADHDVLLARQGLELGDLRIRVEGLSRLAENTVWLMDFDRAIPAVEEALETAREAGDDLNRAILSALVLSRLRIREGDNPGALRLLLDNEDVLVRYNSFYASVSQTFAAYLLLQSGRVGEALSHLATARRVATDSHQPFFVATAAASQGHAFACLGLDELAGEARKAAEAALHTPLGNFIGSTVWAELGYTGLALGDLSSAEAAFEQGRGSSSASFYWEKPRLLIGLALVRARQDDPDSAHRLLDEAQTFLLEKAVRGFDGHLEHARGEALLAEGKASEALERLASAADLADQSEYRLLALQVAFVAARAAAALDDPEGIRRHLDSARTDLDVIANSLDDPALKEALESVWSRSFDQIPTA